jgi:hypothetical protein
MAIPTPPSNPRPFTSVHDFLEDWENRVADLNDPSTRICRQCVIDPDLWRSVADGADDGRCDFCETVRAAVSFEELAVVVEDVVRDRYLSAEESGVFHDDGEWSAPVEDIEVILDELLDGAVGNAALAPLKAFVAERNPVAYGFVRRRAVWASLNDFDEGAWRLFKDQARAGGFAAATEFLLAELPGDVLELFRRIEKVAMVGGLFKRSTPRLWRCRPRTGNEMHSTGSALGSSPVEKADEGRLSVKNQSVFYGSSSLRGAVIEMVTHHGDDVELCAGQFTSTRALAYLDLMEPPPWPSPFAPDAAETDDAIRFRDPKTEDPSHYRPTQIFVAFLLFAPEPLRIDAIKYGSSVDPTSGNWVVFVDNEHCRDLRSGDVLADDLYMLLDESTAQPVVARDHL